MPRPRNLENPSESTRKRRTLANSIGPGREVLRPCEYCSHRGKECRMAVSHPRCIECTGQGRTCDLNFSAMAWRKIDTERKQTWEKLKSARKEISEIDTRATEIMIQAKKAREYEAEVMQELHNWEEKERKMIEQEYRDADELEREAEIFVLDQLGLPDQVEYADLDLAILNSVSEGTNWENLGN